MDFDQINPMVCTHLIYDSIGVDENGELNYLDKSSSQVEGDLTF